MHKNPILKVFFKLIDFGGPFTVDLILSIPLIWLISLFICGSIHNCILNALIVILLTISAIIIIGRLIYHLIDKYGEDYLDDISKLILIDERKHDK